MSWKGLVKAVDRLPTLVKAKANMLPRYTDPEFDRLARAFEQFDTHITSLAADAANYASAVRATITHHIDFGAALHDLYAPAADGRVVGGDDSAIYAREHTAAAELRTLHQALLERVEPYLDRVAREVVAPLHELVEMLRHVKKLMAKREHKIVDVERYNDAVRALKSKEVKSTGAAAAYEHQQKLAKQEALAANATQVLKAHTAPLTEQIPVLLQLRESLVAHITTIFAHIQVHIFTAMSQTMQEFAKRGGVDVSLPAVAEYQRAREALDAQVKDIGILKHGGFVASSAAAASSSSMASGGPVPLLSEVKGAPPSAASTSIPYPAPPPPYKEAAPTPPAMPARTGGRVVVAQFDFAAQAEGDLGFAPGDRIRVLEASDNREDWWRGERLDAQGHALATGIFPANYTRDA